jgi:hypothetical protein
MSSCALCWQKLRVQMIHDDKPCVTRESLWCSQCSCFGHEASECDEASHVERPRTLEELIPFDVRERWGITTSTPIVYHTPVRRPQTLEEKEREIAESNTVVIYYPKAQLDRCLREYMKKNKIDTTHSKEGNIKVLRQWLTDNGKKLRLEQEK